MYLQADVIRVLVQPPISEVQQQETLMHHGEEHQEPADQSSTQPVLPWIVSEDELRGHLAEYSRHHVLHLTGTGHLTMEINRKWERRRSHATQDRWRFILF